ncbi:MULTISPECIES: hypothetical protein [unclassified Candidatus Frackibacter]|nr:MULTISPECIES: hypothetical protein [unclassified Candidatus Frackibacter]SDC85356.1 hypothetical protein SAMN04515661_1317 [Candidatus Frackibacter sp. WG11]SFM07807.1 hypothetical protein SAMN04488699_1329 [Candidatus Frackibacter sp. WG13]
MTGTGLFITIFIIAIIFSAIKSYRYSNENLKDVTSEVDKLIDEIEEINIRSVSNLEVINNLIKQEGSLLKEDWNNYYFVIKNQTDVDKLLDPNYYLGERKLINKYSKRDIANAMPSVLTGLGIFGTFLGLVIGLFQIDNLGAVQLKEEIPYLIGGMKISFLSSLTAIACSLIWTWFDKNLLDKTERKIKKLNDRLHRVLPVRIESNLLDEIIDNQEEQIQTTKEFVSDTLIPELVNGMQEAVDKSLAPSINKMDSNIDKFVRESAESRNDLVSGVESIINDTISPQISEMHEIMDKLVNVSVDKQAESIDKMVGKFMDSFNDAFDHQFEALRDTLEGVIEWQKSTREEMEKLIDTVAQSAKRQDQVLDSTENLLENVRGYVDEFDNLNKNLNGNITKLNEVGSQLSSLEEQTSQKLQTLIESQEEFEEVKKEQINNMVQQLDNINAYWVSIRDNFNQLNNNLTGAMEQFAENTHQGLERTFQSFDNNLAEIANRLGVTINEVNDMVEEIPNTFAQLANLIEEFSLERQEVLERIENQKNLMDAEFKEINTSLKELEEDDYEKVKEILYEQLKDKFSKEDIDELQIELSDIKNLIEEDIKELSNKIKKENKDSDIKFKKILTQVKEEIVDEIAAKLEEDNVKDKTDDNGGLFSRFGRG